MTWTALTGGTLVDGTGAAPAQGSLLMEGDHIAAIGVIEIPAAARQQGDMLLIKRSLYTKETLSSSLTPMPMAIIGWVTRPCETPFHTL